MRCSIFYTQTQSLTHTLSLFLALWLSHTHSRSLPFCLVGLHLLVKADYSTEEIPEDEVLSLSFALSLSLSIFLSRARSVSIYFSHIGTLFSVRAASDGERLQMSPPTDDF